MRYSLVQSVPPTTQPVSLAELKLQARIDADLSDEDTLLASYLAAATRQVETETGRQLMLATWVYRADGFSPHGTLALPRPPLLSVTSVQYVDADGVTQTWDAANYVVDPYRDPGRIVLAQGASWPSTRDVPNAVTITYQAGYGASLVDDVYEEDATQVPPELRHALLLLTAEWYRHREPTEERPYLVLPYAVERLIWPFRTAAVLVG